MTPGSTRSLVPRVRRTVMVAVFLVGATASHASAHGGETALEVVPRVIEPGGTISVYGEELPPSSELELVIRTGSGDRLLGVFVVDVEGHIVAEVDLPRDLSARTYELQLRDAERALATAHLGVISPAEQPVQTSSSPPPAWVVGFAGLVGVGLLATGAILGRRRTG